LEWDFEVDRPGRYIEDARGGSEPVTDIAQTLDVRGQSCPLPVVRASQAIKLLETGQLLEVLATDPGSLTDFPAWSKTTGNEIVEQNQDDGVFRYVVRKA
jgi:tRNA 2-thiouridine synthesizing protein A